MGDLDDEEFDEYQFDKMTVQISADAGVLNGSVDPLSLPDSTITYIHEECAGGIIKIHVIGETNPDYGLTCKTCRAFTRTSSNLRIAIRKCLLDGKRQSLRTLAIGSADPEGDGRRNNLILVPL